ncbi:MULTISPECIES: hypothetical protein [unclassified Clostridium]|uniref:hypothetical protein n=1 Tax=unclassified Clostridium TaxID=2614128 RepID=UPI000E8BAA25|nr:hypothetical protein [Clostridium sp.]
MDIREIPKSQLLKNVSIDQINRCSKEPMMLSNTQVMVRQQDNEYFVIEGLEKILSTDKNKDGDDLIKCYVV